MKFTDRADAGQKLATKLKHLGQKDGVIYALPRGGVATAAEIAHELKLPLDIIIARKIGHPANPEYAIGAVTETGPAIWNEAERSTIDTLWLSQAEAKEREEAKRRRELYLESRKPRTAAGKTAIIIDDGIATGLTMQAAVQSVKQQRPIKIIVAVPCAPPDAIDNLLETADECIVLADPESYPGAVGAYYENFPQLSDKEVINIMEEFEDN